MLLEVTETGYIRIPSGQVLPFLDILAPRNSSRATAHSFLQMDCEISFKESMNSEFVLKLSRNQPERKDV